MTRRNSVVVKVMAWMMVTCLSQVLVWANQSGTTNKAKANNDAAGVAATTEVPLGRLVADGPVTINSVKARTGDTVFPGAQTQTGAWVGASIQIGKLGQLDISPDTKLVLNYDRASIRCEINTGCAVLATNSGVQGMLLMPGGVTKKNDSLKNSTLSACSDSEVNAVGVSGAKSVRVGNQAAEAITLVVGGVSFAEFGSMMLGSTAIVTGLNSAVYQPVAAAANAEAASPIVPYPGFPGPPGIPLPPCFLDRNGQTCIFVCFGQAHIVPCPP